MTSQEVSDLRAIIVTEMNKRGWCRHPDFEDLLQEAMVAVWRVLNKPNAAQWARSTLINRAAVWKIQNCLREPRFNTYARYDTTWQPPISLEELRNENGEENWDRRVGDPRSGDNFAEVEIADFHRSIRSKCAPRSWRIFRRHVLEGGLLREVAIEEGLSHARIYQLACEVKRLYRKEMAR